MWQRPKRSSAFTIPNFRLSAILSTTITTPNSAPISVINFRFNPNRPLVEDVATAEKIFRLYNPKFPFECYFVDDDYNAKFRADLGDQFPLQPQSPPRRGCGNGRKDLPPLQSQISV